MSTLPASVFRTYDIRGIAESEITPDFARSLGRVFGQLVKESKGRKVVLGRDARLSSPELYEAVSEGLVDVGMTVFGLGMVPTPVTYFAEFALNADGGIMITASHNPAPYNGFKMVVKRKTLFADHVQDLKLRMERAVFTEASGGGYQDCEASIKERYENFMVQKFSRLASVNAIVDCGNGVASSVVTDIFDRLRVPARYLFSDPDGTFPNHAPDPVDPENLRELMQAVKRSKHTIGLAYDGDVDRLGVVSESGRMVYGDQLLILFARDLRADGEPLTVIGEVKCSQILYNELARLGVNGIMWKTGHSLIKQKMRETNAGLAGEMSGHFFFAKGYLGFDDGIYASLKLLDILNRSGTLLDDFLATLPPAVNTPEIRTECPSALQPKVIDRLKERFNTPEFELNTIDGVRLLSKAHEGWALVRSSNTQPVLVSRFEAATEQNLRELRSLVESVIQDVLHG